MTNNPRVNDSRVVASPNRTQLWLAVAAGAAFLLALLILSWQMRTQSDAAKPGQVAVPAGALANQAPNQEEHKMLQSLRDHPELARKRIPTNGEKP